MKFKEYSFKDLLVNIVDNRGKTCPTADEGLPLIATNCIKNEALYPVHEKVRYVDQETYDNWFRGHPESGDMIFVCKGSPGRVCWVPNPIGFCIAQDMVAIRADETKVYPKYLFALLRSENTQQKILNMHVGTLIPHFKKGDFGNLYLDVPEDMDYQKKVGDAYFDFCRKIELNRQTNQTFEHIAQAIFKSWFVDFEPTCAKITAKKHWLALHESVETSSPTCYSEQFDSPGQNHISLEEAMTQAAMVAISGKPIDVLDQLNLEQQQQLKTTAALFPDTLVDSELGEIPEGWEVKELNEFVSLKGGLSYKSSFMGSGKPMVTMGCIDPEKRFNSGKLKHYSGDYKPQHKLEPGDLVVSTRDVTQARVTLGAPALIPNYLGDEIILATNMYRLENNGTYLPNAFLFEILRTSRYREQIIASAKGTTVLMLTKDALLKYQLVYPSQELLELAKEIFTNNYLKIEQSNSECEQLTLLRDNLLPKLLSGELSIKPAQPTEAVA